MTAVFIMLHSQFEIRADNIKLFNNLKFVITNRVKLIHIQNEIKLYLLIIYNHKDYAFINIPLQYDGFIKEALLFECHHRQ